MRAGLCGVALAAGIILALVLAVGISSNRSFASRSKPQKVTILFTGDDFGNVKPCGCTGVEDIGGAPRRAFYLRSIQQAEKDVLTVDVGDAVVGLDDFARLKADFYTDAFKHMRYDLVGMGENEARYMTQIASPKPYGDTPVINANIAESASGKLIATQPYIIHETASGVKIGVIAILGQHFVDLYLQQKAGIGVFPPADVLRQHVPLLREKSDVVVVLSHTGIDATRQLAADFPEVDVFLSGHSFHLMLDAPEVIGKTIVMPVRGSGKYVGKLTLDLDEDGKVIGHSGEWVALDDTISDDNDMVELLGRHNRDLEEYYAIMRSRLTVRPDQASGDHRDPQPFIGPTSCRTCHEDQYQAWRKTRHPYAFEKLRKTNQTTDPECASCHTTGFRVKGGYTNEIETPQFRGVQCESCHGPGVIHSRHTDREYGKITKSTCTQCHDMANSPAFDYDKYRPKILHSKTKNP